MQKRKRKDVMFHLFCLNQKVQGSDLSIRHAPLALRTPSGLLLVQEGLVANQWRYDR